MSVTGKKKKKKDFKSLCKQFDESLQSEFKFQVFKAPFKKKKKLINTTALLESSWFKYAFAFL